MEVCCSFKSIVGGMCGSDTRDRKKETQIIPLLACSKAISNHTASLGFSGPIDEVDLRGVECQRHYPIMTEEAKRGRNVSEESGKSIHK